jgi:hypothetical protein
MCIRDSANTIGHRILCRLVDALVSGAKLADIDPFEDRRLAETMLSSRK